MDAEQLRQALIERGLYEAAAMVAADVEPQALEEDGSRTRHRSGSAASPLSGSCRPCPVAKNRAYGPLIGR